ncbi:MAG: ribonuclease III [Culicoidibacterales bacterium]
MGRPTGDQITEFMKQWQLEFKNVDLLKRAFMHTSYVNEESRVLESNERLEYLGDAVLELKTSEFLYANYPDMAEGEMTKFRAQIVREESLVIYAQKLELGKMLFLGRGEEQTGGRKRPAIIADAFESLLGAIYLDLGMEKVQSILEAIVFPEVSTVREREYQDFKSQLQELVQTDASRNVKYEIASESGPAHAKVFVANVIVDEIIFGTGSGRTKKDAEQQAARAALAKLAVNERKD